MAKRRGSRGAAAMIAIVLCLAACSQSTNPYAGATAFQYGTFVGVNSGGAGSGSALSYPRGIAVAGANPDLYIVDSGNARIVMIPGPDPISNTDAATYKYFPNDNTPMGDKLVAPEGIAVDPTGADVWVSDSGTAGTAYGGRIVRLKTADWQTGSPTFEARSSVTRTSTTYYFSYPTGLALQGTTLYVADPGAGFPANSPKVYAIDVSGSNFSGLAAIGSAGSGAYQFYFPRGIAADSNYVYVADESNYRVVRLDHDLSGWKTLGSRGTGTGRFLSPQTVAADGSGSIYVVDSAACWVAKTSVQMDASTWSLLGYQGASISSSVYPNFVAVSGSDVYVSDDTLYAVALFR